jgi:hypothetical protein
MRDARLAWGLELKASTKDLKEDIKNVVVIDVA